MPIPQYTKPTISLGIFEETPLSPSPTSTSTIDPDLEQIFFIDLPPPSRATCIEVGRPGMDWFGELNLGAKYGIGLACLIVMVVAFALFKLYMQKRRTKKIIFAQLAKAADEEGRIENTALTKREEDEGDLFGIRALEKGYTGGVAQSRPTTPTITSGSTTLLSINQVPYGHGQETARPAIILALDSGAGVSLKKSSNKQYGSNLAGTNLKVPVFNPSQKDTPTVLPSNTSTSSTSDSDSHERELSLLLKPTVSTSDSRRRDDFEAPHKQVIPPSLVTCQPMGVRKSTIRSLYGQKSTPSPPSQSYLPSIEISKPENNVPVQNALGLQNETGDSGKKVLQSTPELNRMRPHNAKRSTAASLSDFYDSYYEQAIKGQQPSSFLRKAEYPGLYHEISEKKGNRGIFSAL